MKLSSANLILAVLTVTMVTLAGCGEPLIDPNKTRRTANTVVPTILLRRPIDSRLRLCDQSISTAGGA